MSQLIVFSHLFGRVVEWVDGAWRFQDTKAPVEYGPDRPKIDWVCPVCGLPITAEGHDPCIANLPGVVFACCGHGVEPGYVKFTNGRVLRGQFEP